MHHSKRARGVISANLARVAAAAAAAYHLHVPVSISGTLRRVGATIATEELACGPHQLPCVLKHRIP